MKLNEIAPLDLSVGAAVGAAVIVGVGALALYGAAYWMGRRVVAAMNPCGRAIRDGMAVSDALFLHPRVLAKLRAENVPTEFHKQAEMDVNQHDPNFDARAWVTTMQQRVCIYFKDHPLRTDLISSSIDFNNAEDVTNATNMYIRLDNHATQNNGRCTIEEMIGGPQADLFKPEGEL